MPNHFETYTNMSVADLLEDAAFRSWVRFPGPESEQQWRAFLAKAPAPQQENVKTARLLLLGMTDAIVAPSAVEQAGDFDRLMRSATPGKVRKFGQHRKKWWAAAATILLLLTTLATLKFNASQELLYVTGPGQQQEIHLTDGTTVLLNANSRLRILSKNDRKVELKGEAFFAVNEHQKAGSSVPFYVQTNSLNIKVLGTRFNVKERRGATKVFLEEGSVALDWQDESVEDVLLQPGELATYSANDHQTTLSNKATPATHLGWTSGHLSFDRLPLSAVFAELEDIYGIKFSYRTSSELTNKEMTSAGIPANNLSLAIGLIEKAFGLEIKPTATDNEYLVVER